MPRGPEGGLEGWGKNTILESRQLFLRIRVWSLETRGALVVLLFVSSIHFLSLNGQILDWSDNVRYIILAQSLVSGHYTDDVLNFSIPHAFYPPVFPAILAPVVWLFGTSFVVLKAWLAVISFVAVGISYLALSLVTSRGTALLLAVLVALAPELLIENSLVMSESTFLLLSMAALLSISKYAIQRQVLTRWLFIAAVFMSTAFLSRTIGLALMGALLFLALRGQRSVSRTVNMKKAVALALLFAIPVALWFGWTAYWGASRGSIGYVSSPNDVGMIGTLGPGQVVLDSVSLYSTKIVPKVILPSFDWPFRLMPALDIFRPWIGLVLSTTVVGGFFIRLIAGRSPYEFYVVAYVAMLLIWPYRDYRFLVPVLPFLLLYFVSGLQMYVALLRSAVSHFRGGASSVIKKGIDSRRMRGHGKENKKQHGKRSFCSLRLVGSALPHFTRAKLIALAGLANSLPANGPLSGWTKVAVVTYVVVALMSSVVSDANQVRVAHSNPYYEVVAGPGWQEFVEASQWLRENTSPTSVVMAARPKFLYLLSGNRAIYPPVLGNEPSHDLDSNVRGEADYVLLDKLPRADSLANSPWAYLMEKGEVTDFSIVYSIGSTRIYKVKN